ncbi:MAG: zinc ABC transporter substrate-binding protein, partial [Candidatus Latescibacterota bacterium]
MRLKILLFYFLLGILGFSENAIITTTSKISSVIEEIGGKKVKVIPLIPPGECPGHFDIKV